MNGVSPNKWMDYIPGVKVYYASVQNLRLNHIREHVLSVRPDCIYLNSMFSKRFTIYPLWLKRSNRIPGKIILAPRGMLKSSALNFKKSKKRVFLSMLKWMKIPQLVTFHATDEQEKEDVLRQFGTATRVEIITNFPGSQDELSLPHEKKPGFLNILFVGRIHPIKGLDLLLNVLKHSQHQIRLSVVGNPEDINYMHLCRRIISEFPDNVE